jgi:hypothetical protein
VPEETSSPAPKIRAVNPPPSKVAEMQNFKEECRRFDTYEYVSMGTLATFGLALAFWSASAPFFIFIAAAFIWQQFNKKRKELDRKGIIVNEPLDIDTHPIEFRTLLADNTLFYTKVHFRIPRTFDYKRQLFDSTENLLERYSQQFKDPPAKEAVEEYLQTSLVRFQDETNLSYLEVNVSISFRIEPNPDPDPDQPTAHV